MKFQTRLFLYHAGIVIFIIGGTVASFFHVLFSEMKERTERDFMVIAQKTVVQADDLFDAMDQVALQVAANPNIVATFQALPNQKGNYFSEHPLEATEVRLLLESYNFKRDGYARICLYNESGDFICTATEPVTEQGIFHFFNGSSFKKVEYYFKEGDKQRYTYFRKPSADILAMGTAEEVYSFSTVREIKDYYLGGNTCGYVEVQETTEKLDEILMNLGEGVCAELVDENGGILYSSDKTHVHEARDMKIELPLQSNPCSLRLYRGEQEYRKAVRNFIFMMLIIVVSILFLSLIMVRMLMKFTLKPLISLADSLKTVTVDNLHVNIADDSSEDIIINLESYFNKMLEKLNRSMQSEMLAKVNEIKSQFLALQSQMNPHFLHNMLAIIAMEAQSDSENESKIPSICQKLGEMLRYTSHMGNGYSTMEEEIRIAEDYLDLMKIRYEDMFEYQLQADGEIMGISIPKLILQPICENCFQHGFKYVEAPWEISVKGWKDGNRWFLEVRDNGCGFSEEFLAHFEENKESLNEENVEHILERMSIGGLCLPNIYIRLKMLYENTYVFKLYNEQNGAVVLLGGLINDENTDSGR